MKNSIEIIQNIGRLGWSVYRLSQATGESEFDIKTALSNPDKTETRRKISDVTGIAYSELFGEEI